MEDRVGFGRATRVASAPPRTGVVLVAAICLSVWLGASCGRSNGTPEAGGPDSVRRQAEALAAEARALLQFLDAAFGGPGERRPNWPLSEEQDAWVRSTWLGVRRDLSKLTSRSGAGRSAEEPDLLLASLRDRITALRRAVLPLRKAMTYAGGEESARQILGDQDITDPPRAWREAEERLLRALSETLLEQVRLDIWLWRDGDTKPAGELYSMLGLFEDPSLCEQLNRYTVLAELSRAPLGSRDRPSPEEGTAEPIRLLVTLVDAQDPHAWRICRGGDVREADVRSMSVETVLAHARDRHAPIAADLKIVVAPR